MASSINGTSTGSGGLISTGDDSGILNIQTNETTAISIDASQNLSFTKGFTVGSTAFPAFSAYQSTAQTLPANTLTKLLFQTEEFDTNNNFASSTFTPTVAGYYLVNAALQAGATATLIQCVIYKNGSFYKGGFTGNNTSSAQVTFTVMVYCNGSTDYIEAWGFFQTSQVTYNNSGSTYFQAAMIRSA